MWLPLMWKEFGEWQKDNQRHDGRVHQRKFQFKMGLPKIIQIPCHNVLANQNDLKFKKGAPLKQFFNINLGIGIIKNTTFFVSIFDIFPCVFTQISIGRSRWMQN